jgi:hypothetical protein
MSLEETKGKDKIIFPSTIKVKLELIDKKIRGEIEK